MSEYISIRPFTEADFKDIMHIADNRFGNAYLSLNELKTYLNNRNKIGLVALVNTKIAGFAFAQICDFDAAIKLVLCDHEWFQEQFEKAVPIGVLKTIAVHPTYSNKGIGTALTNYRIAMLKKSTNSIFAVSWEQKQNSFNLKILENSGFTRKRRIENYWMEDSQQKGYTCEACGTPPCKCTALIYWI
jgi:ribosomal protein S18 acetylase RimI-like enzyme